VSEGVLGQALIDEPLSRHTSLELGGPARFFVHVEDSELLAPLLLEARRHELRVAVLGGGSNLVVSDRGFDGLVIAIRNRGVTFVREGDRVLALAAAGEPWDPFVERTVAANLAGLECLSGIPGLVGGAPIQNIGAYGQDVSETITKVRALDRQTLETVEISAENCRFEYRNSAFKRDPERYIVLSVVFALREGAAPKVSYAELERALEDGSRTLASVRDAVIALRRRKSMVIDPNDPNRRSAGSFFTNPIVERAVADALGEKHPTMPRWEQPDGHTKLAAGWLIEQSGMKKGTKRGPVGISTEHALALVHHGDGTTRELLALADEVRGMVHARFGIVLELEPVLWSCGDSDSG
jgi:UDP-N-acetylmuramate dehydrogenase